MGVGGQPHTPAASTPGKESVPIVQEAGWAPGPVWTGSENFVPTGIRSRTVQPMASRCTDWAIPAHLIKYVSDKISCTKVTHLLQFATDVTKSPPSTLSALYNSRANFAFPASEFIFTFIYARQHHQPKCERAIRLAYSPSCCKLRYTSNPTNKNLTELILRIQVTPAPLYAFFWVIPRWRRSVVPFMWEMKCYLLSRIRGISYMK